MIRNNKMKVKCPCVGIPAKFTEKSTFVCVLREQKENKKSYSQNESKQKLEIVIIPSLPRSEAGMKHKAYSK